MNAMKMLPQTIILLTILFQNTYAATIAPLENAYLSGVAPFGQGTLLDSLTVSYSVTDLLNSNAVVATGTVVQSVWRAQDGTVDFYWQLSNDASSTVAIEALRVAGFGSDAVNTEYIANPSAPSEVAPVVATRFGGFLRAQGSINFLFNDFAFGSDVGVNPGETSSVIFIDTSATDFALGTDFSENVSDGFFDVTSDGYQVSSLFSAFGPIVVPIPSAVWLFGTGLLGIIGISRRKKTA
jgi:hypothetical protein